MSVSWFIVTTSASSPSSTARACAVLPPCDMVTVTSWPVLSFQSLTNNALRSW